MKKQLKLLSISDISEMMDREDEKLLYGQFLDHFYYADKDTKSKLIEIEPQFRTDNKVFMCMLAGTVHILCNKFNLKTPLWVFKDIYKLDTIYYAFDTKNPEFQGYLRQTTPKEYAARNLYVGETMLERC